MTSVLISRRTAIAALGAVAVTTALAEDMPIRLAIKGYDPVGYFTEGRPTMGSSAFEYVWDGVRWQFASAANRDQFRTDPDRYAPRYDGYCALGVALGMKAEVDPQAWTIVDGKLYLNFDQQSRDKWRQNIVANIEQADSKWPSLRR